jgi:hypothetical protein
VTFGTTSILRLGVVTTLSLSGTYSGGSLGISRASAGGYTSSSVTLCGIKALI